MSSKRKTKKNASNSVGKSLRTIIKKEDDGENSKGSKNGGNRGIVYLGNLPPGFYEQQMMDYFSQFGKVTRLRLCRSKKTGKSKGYAYIEFLIPEVAKVVAETMNRYLMHKRLLKARYIAPEDQQMNYFPNRTITESDYPRKRNRNEYISNLNAAKTEEQEQEKVRRLLGKVKKIQEELKKYNIVYNFEPVEVPEKMAELVESFNIYKTQATSTKVKPNLVKIKFEKSDTTDEVERETKISKSNLKPMKIMKSKVKVKKEKSNKSPVKKPKKINKSNLESVPLQKFKGTSKLFGITKKKKNNEVFAELKNPKKMNLIKNEIFNNNQIKLRTAQDIKKSIKNKQK